MKWITSSLLILLALTLFWAIGCYNRLQGLRANALQSLAQHAAACAARNSLIAAICESLSSNLQHERALFSAAQNELHRNSALAEAATLARGTREAMDAFALSEQALAHQLQNLREAHAAYPELTVNASLSADWQALDAALSRCRFSCEQFNTNAKLLDMALLEKPACWLAQTTQLRKLENLPFYAEAGLSVIPNQATLL